MTQYKSKKTGELSTKDGYEIAEYDDGAWRFTGDGGKTKGAIAIRQPEEEFTIEEDHPMNVGKMSELAKVSGSRSVRRSSDPSVFLPPLRSQSSGIG